MGKGAHCKVWLSVDQQLGRLLQAHAHQRLHARLCKEEQRGGRHVRACEVLGPVSQGRMLLMGVSAMVL